MFSIKVKLGLNSIKCNVFSNIIKPLHEEYHLLGYNVV
jgi:hypothetical protein